MFAAQEGQGALVIVPTYNERENIGRLLRAIRCELPKADILIVDDHSPDGTAGVVAGCAAADGGIHLLQRRGPRGLGPAYLDGFRWALARDYARICCMDADFSHPPRFLPRFLQAAEQADLVQGCRYMPGGGVVGWGPHRILLSRTGNAVARAMLDLPYRDLTGGFKCIRRAVLEGIDLAAVRSVGYTFQIELTWRAARAGFSITEIPICFPDRLQGTSKMSLAICGEAIRNLWIMRNTPLT